MSAERKKGTKKLLILIFVLLVLAVYTLFSLVESTSVDAQTEAVRVLDALRFQFERYKQAHKNSLPAGLQSGQSADEFLKFFAEDCVYLQSSRYFSKADVKLMSVEPASGKYKLVVFLQNGEWITEDELGKIAGLK